MSEPSEKRTQSAHPVLKIAAPFVVLVATWAVDRALTAGYSAITGRTPPSTDDSSVSFPKALVWTLATSSTAAVIQLVIYRAAAKPVPENEG